MTKEKVEKETKETSTKVDIEDRVTALEKQSSATAYTLRRVKNWLETLHGADIDGDGQIGKARRNNGTTRIVLAVVIALSCAAVAHGASAYILNLSRRGTAYPFSVGTNHITYAEYLTTSNNAIFGGNVSIAGTLTNTGNIVAIADLSVGDSFTVNTNATILQDGIIGRNLTVSNAINSASMTTALAQVNGNLTVTNNVLCGNAITTVTAFVGGILTLENGEYFSNIQDTYIKISGHPVSLGDGTFNLGATTQQWGYLYLKETANIENATIRDGATIGTNLTVSGVTTTDVLTVDTSSTFPAGDILISEIESGVMTNTTIQTGTVTGSGANDLVTATGTLTPETGTVTASGANDLVTPTATMTLETGIVTAEGANNMVTPTATITPERVTVTNWHTAVYQYGTFTNDTLTHTNVFSTVTGITWSTTAYSPITNATCAITPDLASNTVVAVTVTGGGAVLTNATCAITPDLASNTVVAVTVTGGAGLWTNATCAITPDLASNSVVAVTVTGGGAVVTNVVDETN